MACVRLVRHEDISACPASDWSMLIRFLQGVRRERRHRQGCVPSSYERDVLSPARPRSDDRARAREPVHATGEDMPVMRKAPDYFIIAHICDHLVLVPCKIHITILRLYFPGN